MTALFTQALTMSAVGALVILIVLASRLLLRRGPRLFCFLLWIVVFLRLLLPFSLKVTVPAAPEFDAAALVAQWAQEMDTVPAAAQTQSAPAAAAPASGPDVLTVLSWVWTAGVVCVALAGIVSFLRLKRRLRTAVPLEDNIRMADHIGAPFVVGLLRPKIYLPSELSEGEREYILAHERHHIRRFDHVTKLLAFAALAIHWFNPLVWVAFHLFSRDMEMSCDEAVLKKLGTEIRSDYSQSLLNLTTGRRGPVWTPLAFGEGNTGKRIRNILKWKRPSAGMVVLTAVITVVVALSAITEAQGVSVLPDTPAATAEEAILWADLQLPEDLSASIVRSYATHEREPLTDGQTATLTGYLRSLSTSQLTEAPAMTTLFTISLDGGHTVRFGYQGGDSYVTVDGWAVNSDSLAAFLYHVCVSNSPIHYPDGTMPADAVLQSSEHGVRIYSYYCNVCGQYEQASDSDRCGCCSLNEVHHFHQTRQIK